MPRGLQVLSATEMLVRDLNDLGLAVSVRTVRQWARLGLAPAPTRRSLGRGKGMASTYPDDALDQYAAVASVMRRGLRWHLGVVVLVGRAHLPASEATLREAFRLFFQVNETDGTDNLDRAETAARASRRTRTACVRQIVRSMDSNFRRAKLRDPVTGDLMDHEEGVHTVLTNMALMTTGTNPISEEDGIVIAAAQGLLTGLPPDVQGKLGPVVADIYNELLSFPILAEVACRVDPTTLRLAVRDIRDLVSQGELPDHLPQLPVIFWDVAYALFGLALVRMTELGGAEAFFDRHRDALMTLGPVLDGLGS